MSAKFLILPLLLTGLLPRVFSDDGFDERKSWFMSRITSEEPSFKAKQGSAVACAKLYQSGGTDQTMIDYFAEMDNENAGEGDVLFAALGLVRAALQFPDAFTTEQIESIGDYLDDYPVWNAYGSETWQIRSWSSGYLAGQLWPTRTFTFTMDDESEITVTGEELQQRMKDIILREGKLRFQNGYSEFASVNYEVFHLAALLNLYDFAEDAEVKNAAEALLDYHTANLALTSFDGRIVAPYTRSYGPQGRDYENMQISNWIHYAYWGMGSPVQLSGRSFFSAYLYLSDWRPSAAVDSIAKNTVDRSFATRQLAPFKDYDIPRYMMRKGFITPHWAMGGGAMRHAPDKFTIDDAAFAINLKTDDEYASIQAFHPYFYADEENDKWGNLIGGEDFWRPVSPFMQKVTHRNAAILLFDIPRFDPWRSRGSWWPGYHENFFQHRDQHYRRVKALGQLRFPASMDQAIQRDEWWFIQEGEAYVAIHCLKPGHEVDQQEDWTVLKSRETQTGFILEAASSEEFSTFEAFQNAILANTYTVDWETLTADYTTTEGEVLSIRFNVSTDEPDGSVPQTWINGDPEAYDDSWPVIESPWVTLKDEILVVAMDSSEEPTVWNWQEDAPVRMNRPPLLNAPSANIEVHDNGTASITTSSQLGWRYSLYSSNNFNTWSPESEPVMGIDGQVSFAVEDENSLFYQVRLE